MALLRRLRASLAGNCADRGPHPNQSAERATTRPFLVRNRWTRSAASESNLTASHNGSLGAFREPSAGTRRHQTWSGPWLAVWLAPASGQCKGTSHPGALTRTRSKVSPFDKARALVEAARIARQPHRSRYSNRKRSARLGFCRFRRKRGLRLRRRPRFWDSGAAYCAAYLKLNCKYVLLGINLAMPLRGRAHCETAKDH
jgi:hypothetical protein